jgi:hypothetical protein
LLHINLTKLVGGFVNLRFLTADEREALYNEVWSEPMITVSKRYGMSDNGLRKHCKTLGIPLPPLGYWARIKAGQKVPRADLPKVTGEVMLKTADYDPLKSILTANIDPP